MLAIMACVLGELRMEQATAATAVSVKQQHGNPFPPLRLSRSETESTRYFPSKAVGVSLLNYSSPLMSSPAIPTHMNRAKLSGISSNSQSNSDPDSSLSAKATSSVNYSLHRKSLERGLLSSHYVSTSPEQLRHTHRSTLNLANKFASLSRPFSFQTSTSNSPPINQKRGSIPIRRSTNPQTEYTLNPSSFFSKSFGNTDDGPSETEQRVTTLKGGKGSTRSKAFRVRLVNQDQFDMEGHAVVPLLLDKHASRYKGYRDAYAYQLSAWEMWPKKIEILKFNATGSRMHRTQETCVFDSPRTRRRKSMTGKVHENVLSVQRTCRQCHTIEPHGSNSQSIRCSKCSSNAVAPTCALCAERILGLGNACLACGHALHSACLTLLTSHFEEHPEEAQCPAGCGCQCSGIGVADVEVAEDRSRRTSAPIIREHINERGWGDVAYESLAKNLSAEGKKHIRPKTSQIWRGIERKQSQHG